MKLLLLRVRQAGATSSRGALFIIFAIIFAIGAVLPVAKSKLPPSAFSTPTILSPSLNIPNSFPNYVITQFTGASIVPGTTDTGNHYDDGTTTISLPFNYQLYDQTFGSVVISSNGTLQFNSNNSTYVNGCLPDGNFSYT